MWLRAGGGEAGGAGSGAVQSQHLWHSLAGEGAFSDLSPASLGRVPRAAGRAVPGVKVQNKSR